VVVPKFFVAVTYNVQSLDKVLDRGFEGVAVGHIVKVSYVTVSGVWRVVLHNTSKYVPLDVGHVPRHGILSPLHFNYSLNRSKLGAHMAQYTYHIFTKFVVARNGYEAVAVPHTYIKISAQQKTNIYLGTHQAVPRTQILVK
jgi:hypothetical protein